MHAARWVRSILIGMMCLLGLQGRAALAAQPMIEFYRASTTYVETLQGVRLWWKVHNAVRVDIYDGFRNTVIPELGNENYIEVWPERTATYTLQAYGSAGERVEQPIVIEFAPLEIEFFQASTPVSTPRAAVRLSWKVQGASRVDIHDSFQNTTYPNLGNENVIDVYPERTAVYTLFAYGQGRTLRQQVTVAVERNEPVIAEFVASTSVIYRPEPVFLRWTVYDAERVDIEDGITGQVYSQVGLQGQIQVRPDRTATYTLRAYGPQGQVATRQLTITVENRSPTIHFFRALNTFLQAGQSTTLEWRVEPASRVQVFTDQGRLLYQGHTALQSIPITPPRSTTYTLRVFSGFGTEFVEAFVRVDVATP
jgi:hypothetical protein